jgi:hypothetical protein
MLITWRGRGYLVFVVTFGLLIAAEFLSEAWAHDDTYYQKHGWPSLVGFLLAAGVISWLTNLDKDDPVFREHDSLFLIPVRFWPRVLLGLAIFFYFAVEKQWVA